MVVFHLPRQFGEETGLVEWGGNHQCSKRHKGFVIICIKSGVNLKIVRIALIEENIVEAFS